MLVISPSLYLTRQVNKKEGNISHYTIRMKMLFTFILYYTVPGA